MPKSNLRHALLPVSAWLMFTPAAGAAEDQAAAPSAPPALATPFDQYRKFREEPLKDWQLANARVHEAGGWRSYLRESQTGEDADGRERHRH